SHVLHEVVEERTRLVHGVELLRFTLRQMGHALSDDGEPRFLEPANHFADEVTGHTVGLDDGKSALERHGTSTSRKNAGQLFLPITDATTARARQGTNRESSVSREVYWLPCLAAI